MRTLGTSEDAARKQVKINTQKQHSIGGALFSSGF